MDIQYNEKDKKILFKDDMKGRLLASRILASIVFIVGLGKMYLIEWKAVTAMDMVYIAIEVVFVYLLYKNYWVRTAADELHIEDVKFFKKATGMKTRAYFKLKNGREREVFQLKTTTDKEKIYKVVKKAGIEIRA